MELLNFSTGEMNRINQALRFVGPREVDLEPLTARTLIVKTENFVDECEQLAPYFPPLGLESGGARLVFNPAKSGLHKILIDKSAISGLSYLHNLVTELVHLGNLSRFNTDHGNVYRLEPDRAIADHYYEFLLWSRFQAMRIATRAHALASWHEVNGEAPPEDGRYHFAEVRFASDDVQAALQRLHEAATLTAWREHFWTVLEELALYLGRLGMYQQDAQPGDLDERFPAASIDAAVGLEPCLSFYAALMAARDYPGWLAQKQAIRRAVVAMEERGKRRYEHKG